MWNQELEVAKKAAVEAGHEILRIYDGQEDLQVEYKEGNSPLTIADKAANAIIVEMLRKAFPDHAILSEEEKDNRERLHNDLCFVVDPLDGTKEFLKHNGQFTVNIALSYQHETVMGVIYVPVTGELYYASQNDGAFLADSEGNVTRLNVSDCTQKSDFRVVMSSSHGCKEMEELIQKYQFQNLVKIGSSLKGCLVARGDAEIYYRHNPTMEWDTAAMQCIVEEAGGIFRQMDDTPMRYNREDSLNAKGFYILNRIENLL
ncbi:MAG: 3'(2'),5'-bisphosphate nucleotidase CysQ [Bacteroidales bacterium]|nr:3'(2'),5'-bisphosphate nucleotidase CysQ [Bacteroidales bacterium]MCM1414517.1 3'(2'),5'-bisphosphate nucleotidase CysQ [bacterium]MCM1422568.1 3'(2'),5'-bisphosphate nucleotidase CysQ [bacterium]